MSDYPQIDRYVKEMTRLAGIAYRRALRWLERALNDSGVIKEPPPRIQWVDRAGASPTKHNRGGRADAVTGAIVHDTDAVWVCSRCDATYLTATWREITRLGDHTCPVCKGRNTVHPL